MLIPYGESFANVVKVMVPVNNTNDVTMEKIVPLQSSNPTTQHIAIIITVVGVVIADYTSDALQNPSRAYLLDVCRAGKNYFNKYHGLSIHVS